MHPTRKTNAHYLQDSADDVLAVFQGRENRVTYFQSGDNFPWPFRLATLTFLRWFSTTIVLATGLTGVASELLLAVAEDAAAAGTGRD